MELEVIICGQAGQGVRLGTELLARVFVRGGYHAFAAMDVMSRIRGGHNAGRVRIGERPVAGSTGKARLLVALDPAQVKLHLDELEPGGVVLAEEGEELEPGDYHVVQAGFERIAVERGKSKVMQNLVALGAVLGLLDYDVNELVEVVKARFGSKSPELVERNSACCDQGFALMRTRARVGTLARIKPMEQRVLRQLVSGAQAIALGAVASGVKLVAGYPMSPGTPVLETCASWAERAGMVVEQVEDEVAAVNLAIGSSFAGALGMVVTSGGGFALMNEGLSLAGMTETGVVVCLGMRPGPGTGLATRTAQADLLFAVSAGHGEFPRAVLAPGDAAEAFWAVNRAAHLAHRYQIPAIVLFDQFLGDGLWTVEKLGAENARPVQALYEARALVPYQYRRYERAESGVSVLIPVGSANQLVYADSDEHTAEGHITESVAVRRQMVEKRLAKLRGIGRETLALSAYPEPGAGTVVFSFGSTKRIVQEAVERLRSEGLDVGMVHFCDLWPFPTERVLELVERTRSFLTVENNQTGQLAQLIAQEVGLRVRASVTKFDGRPFTVAEVEAGIRELVPES